MIETIGYISILFPWALGMLTLWYLFKPIKATQEVIDSGFDTSNRINRFIILWRILREPWILSPLPGWKFTRMDVGEQIEIIEDNEDGK